MVVLEKRDAVEKVRKLDKCPDLLDAGSPAKSGSETCRMGGTRQDR